MEAKTMKDVWDISDLVMPNFGNNNTHHILDE